MTAFNPHEGLTLNPVQTEALPWVEKEDNLVVASPTGSGKTLIAEKAMVHHLCRGHRVIYISPMKALAEEKISSWRQWPWGLSIITSDYQKASPSDITVITPEALDSKSRSKLNYFPGTGLVVVDEAHLLAAPSRGDALEMALMRITLRESPRLIALSATLSNVEDLTQWFSFLNRRGTRMVKSEWRPIELEKRYLRMPNKEGAFDFRAIDFIHKTLIDAPEGSQVLIFVHTISKGMKYSQKLHIPFHNARLPKEERREIEEGFRSGEIEAIISTSTLALGVNLPADIGIIVGAHRGITPVDPLDILQMMGRIGRYGLSTKGDVFFLIKDYMFDTYEDLGLPPIRSVLPKRLHFHIVSLLAREDKDPRAFLNRSFAKIPPEAIDEALETLIKIGALKESLQPLPLGKGAALFYCDPLDLAALKENLKNLPKQPKDVAKALASVPSLEQNIYVPKDLPFNLPWTAQSAYASAIFGWLTGQKTPSSLRIFLSSYRKDFKRWANALSLAGLRHSYCEGLSIAMEHGLPLDVVDLAKIPGVGRVKAMRLFAAGYKTLEDVKEDLEGASKIGGKSVMALRPKGKKFKVPWD